MMLNLPDIAAAMRGRRTLMLAITGGVLGLAASLMAYHYLEREEAQLRDKLKGEQARDLVSVVVAKADLPAGATVTADNMAARPVPKDYVYAETVPTADFDKISGQSLVKPLGKGQPLLLSYLSEAGATGLADKIKAGRRAVSINVDEVSSMNGLILPGDRIDLMMTMRNGGLVVPLLEDVKVLATGSQLVPKATAQPGDDKFGLRYATLTLDVTPQQAEKVILARGSGTLTAALRGRDAGAELAALAPMQAEELYTPAAQWGGLGQTVTYIVRGGQTPGMATVVQLPIGLPVPPSALPPSAKGGEALPRAMTARSGDEKPGERDKQ